jgi:hypothetical protein
MQKSLIEQLPEVQLASRVLRTLEEQGLSQPAIASGWIRGYLVDLEPSDIDVCYVGNVHFEQAQAALSQALEQLQIDPENWDIKGIWNAEIANPLITSIEQHLLRDYVCSIDSVYLAADGQLHDTTGHGFADAQSRILRLNDLETGPARSAKAKAYIFLEACRRMAKFGWEPTPETIERIRGGAILWEQLSSEAKDYLTSRLRKKYSLSEYRAAQEVYERYGWGFVFDPLLDR